MIYAIVLFLLLGFAAVLVYLNFPPKYADKKLIKTFDKMVLIVTAIVCLSFYFSGKVNLPFSADIKESVAVIATVIIGMIFLFVCFLIRNFWMFKPPRRPGGF